jgi:hypothetical protein
VKERARFSARVNGWWGTLLVLHFLICILGSCREFCEEICCIEMIEMKGGILLMENCDLYFISFLFSCFLIFVLIS